VVALTYLFYHSMWARKCKWADLIDEDSGDALFDKFLMSGAALRFRPGGTHLFGEAAVLVSRTLPLNRVSEVKTKIIAAVEGAVPNIVFSVNAIPRALDDETVLERVLLTAAHWRIPVHHVMVQNVDGRHSVSLDMEVDDRMSLGAAHAKASKLEAAIRDELGAETEVEAHIEPLKVKHLEGTNASEAVYSSVSSTLSDSAKRIDGLGGIHDVRVRQTPQGIIVNYHCQFDPDRDVAFVHSAVDELERRMRSALPELVRIIGHSEPSRSVNNETALMPEM